MRCVFLISCMVMSIFYGLSSAQLSRLELAFNACIRYAFRLRRIDGLSRYRRSILICTLPEYFDFRVLLAIYKIITGRSPTYLRDRCIFLRSTRTRHLLVRHSHTLLMSESFFCRGIVLWNQLPISIRNSGTIDSFKLGYFLHFGYDVA